MISNWDNSGTALSPASEEDLIKKIDDDNEPEKFPIPPEFKGLGAVLYRLAKGRKLEGNIVNSDKSSTEFVIFNSVPLKEFQVRIFEIDPDNTIVSKLVASTDYEGNLTRFVPMVQNESKKWLLDNTRCKILYGANSDKIEARDYFEEKIMMIKNYQHEQGQQR